MIRRSAALAAVLLLAPHAVPAAFPHAQSGWRSLFDGKTTSGWRGFKKKAMPEGWSVIDGALTRGGKAGDIVPAVRPRAPRPHRDPGPRRLGRVQEYSDSGDQVIDD
jgi:hypothetical protein